MKLVRFSGGFLLGALVGGGLVLLLTPRSGESIRMAVRDHFQAAWREGQDAAEARRRELTAQLEKMKASGG